MSAPRTGWVQIVSTDPPANLVVRLSDARPNVTAGYGGWTEVSRPRRRPLSIWVGSPGLRLDLPILFDGYAAGNAVEADIATLELLATPSASDGAPARLRISAPGGSVPHQDRTWVIDTLTWGDALMDRSGNRVRQQVTVALFEYIADVRIAEDSAAGRQRIKAKAVTSKAGASSKRIVAGRGRTVAKPKTRAAASTDTTGEDLLSIAARELGDADRWVEIAQLNGIRDPRSIQIGQVIRLP